MPVPRLACQDYDRSTASSLRGAALNREGRPAAPLFSKPVFHRRRARKTAFGYHPQISTCVLLSISGWRSEEHTSELQSLMRISYAVFCLKNKNISKNTTQ